MSVWSREDGKTDRMGGIVQAYKAEQIDRAVQLEAQMRLVANLLHDVSRCGGELTAAECKDLAELMEAQL